MSLNETPSANRIHIAFFGRRNAGKSSLVNAVTGQNLALVSEVKGTTTDPVYKAMELLPLGPVVIIDTPGFDDEGSLGEMRVERAKKVLNKTDAAVLVLDGESALEAKFDSERELINLFESKGIPFLTVLNKYDLMESDQDSEIRDWNERLESDVNKYCEKIEKLISNNEQHTAIPHFLSLIAVSAKKGLNINLLKEKIAEIANTGEPRQKLAADLIKPNDFVILVIPIDKAAPKGRLILPQQQMIRDILEAGGNAISVRESELEKTLENIGKKPALVITDSQVFKEVSALVPQDIPLTSFSILFARYKGFLETAVTGVKKLDILEDGDKILICEGCTHHRQCDDIGTVKIPRLIRGYSKKEPEFIFCSGGDYPVNLSEYKLIIHCGSCMLNEREMHYRRNLANEQNIPFTNYGITIAHIQGILKRSIAMLN
ncbi:MAG: [FeFe] hydrogenase H-cluster maturation GTPase HydF [Treponema sp.]|jgi:small GTP-binding protein|nr:[FeFe] hydrogenase H-cluster maturation GTPase HydF [Treponema sp.]